MAVLTNPTILASSGGSGLPMWVVLGFQKASANDTFDLSTLSPAFQTVEAALAVATSNRTATDTLCTISTTTVTVLGTGVAADSILLFAVGS